MRLLWRSTERRRVSVQWKEQSGLGWNKKARRIRLSSSYVGRVLSIITWWLEPLHTPTISDSVPSSMRRQISTVVTCLITCRVKPAQHAGAALSQHSQERAITHGRGANTLLKSQTTKIRILLAVHTFYSMDTGSTWESGSIILKRDGFILRVLCMLHRLRSSFISHVVPPCRKVPLNLVNEDLTLGEDLWQLLLELSVLLVIRQRLNWSGAQSGGEVMEGLETSRKEDGSDKRSQRENEESLHRSHRLNLLQKVNGQTNNFMSYLKPLTISLVFPK